MAKEFTADQPGKKNKKSLKRQTILIIALLVIPFNLFTAILGRAIINNATTSAELTVSSLLNSSIDRLDTRINNTIYYIYNNQSNNSDFINFTKQPTDWHYDFYRTQVVSNLRSDLEMTTAAQYMFIYTSARDDMIIINARPFSQDGKDLILSGGDILPLINDDNNRNTSWFRTTVNDVPFLVIISEKNGVYMGALICLGETLSETASYIEYENFSLYFSEEANMTSGSGIHVSAKSAAPNLHLCCDIAQKDITGNTLLNYGIIYLVVLSFMIVPVLSIFFNKNVDMPLNRLRKAFTELESGNDSYRIEESSKYVEFDETYESFNRMADRLVELREDAIVKEQQKQQLTVDNLKLQLSYLQLQIRPHFLHNNMNFLYTLIQNGNTKGAQSLVLYLAEYFRYMFRKGHDKELFDRELNLIREYLEISKLHYPDAFTVSYQIDPVLSHMRIPPLLLHSFIENIIQHALVPGRTVHIILFGEYDDGMVTLQIADDGSGMDDESVNLINSGDFSSVPEGRHVGIKNALLRLKNMYGDEASLSVESFDGNGTIFTITIPYSLSEADEDETTDG